LGALGFSFKVKSKKDFYFKYRNENVFLRDALKDKTIDNDLLLTFSTPSPKLSKFNLTSVANQNAPIKISMVIPALAFLGTDEERNNLTWQQMCATADGPAQQPYVPIVGNVSFYEYKKPLLSLVGYYRYDVEFKTAFSFNESDGCFYAEQSLPSFALIYGGNEYDTG
jgi:hypothetical protein